MSLLQEPQAGSQHLLGPLGNEEEEGGFFPDGPLLLQACPLCGFGCRQLSGWSVRCVTNRNAEDLLPWLLKAEVNFSCIVFMDAFQWVKSCG